MQVTADAVCRDIETNAFAMAPLCGIGNVLVLVLRYIGWKALLELRTCGRCFNDAVIQRTCETICGIFTHTLSLLPSSSNDNVTNVIIFFEKDAGNYVFTACNEELFSTYGKNHTVDYSMTEFVVKTKCNKLMLALASSSPMHNSVNVHTCEDSRVEDFSLHFKIEQPLCSSDQYVSVYLRDVRPKIRGEGPCCTTMSVYPVIGAELPKLEETNNFPRSLLHDMKSYHGDVMPSPTPLRLAYHRIPERLTPDGVVYLYFFVNVVFEYNKTF